MSEVEELEKELERLRDISLDMLSEKECDKAEKIHSRIERIKKQIKRYKNAE